ncbi:hypothetical protein [Nocardia sp. NPDC004711]
MLAVLAVAEEHGVVAFVDAATRAEVHDHLVHRVARLIGVGEMGEDRAQADRARAGDPDEFVCPP